MALNESNIRENVLYNAQWEEIINKIGSSNYAIDCSTRVGIQKAYKQCDVVSTVIGESANAMANLRVYAIDRDGKEVDTPKTREVLGKLAQPNPRQSFKLFFRGLDTMCKLYGKAYVRKFKNSVGGLDYYVIPNHRIDPQYDLGVDLLFNRIVKKYIVNVDGKILELTPDEVYVINDNRLSFINETSGDSRLASLSQQISTYVILWEVLCGLYGEGGARNAIFLGHDGINAGTNTLVQEEKKSLLERMKYGMGLRKAQTRDAILTSKGSVARLTAPITEMDMVNSCKMCIKAICNAYGYPSELMGTDAARYKLVTELMAKLYTQSAIPTFEYYGADWLVMVGASNQGFTLQGDFSHTDIYKDSQMSKAASLQAAGQSLPNLTAPDPVTGQQFMSREEWRVQIGLG